MLLKTALLRTVQPLFVFVLGTLAFACSAFAATPATKNADAAKLLSRLSDLSEIIPAAPMTPIQLYGAVSLDRLDETPPGPFHAKGQILSIFEAYPERDPWSLSYLVIDADSSNPTTWIALKFQLPGNERYGFEKGQEQFRLLEYPAGAEFSKDSSVRFYNGKLDGEQATLVFYSERDFTGVKRDRFEVMIPTPVVFSLFELRASIHEVPGEFVRVARITSRQKYCSVDIALAKELSLQIPSYDFSSFAVARPPSEEEIKELCHS